MIEKIVSAVWNDVTSAWSDMVYTWEWIWSANPTLAVGIVIAVVYIFYKEIVRPVNREDKE